MNIFIMTFFLLLANHYEGFCSNADKSDLLEKDKLINKRKTREVKNNPELSEEQMQNLMNQARPAKKTSYC